MPVDVLQFDEALNQADGTKHVLLGNGFSRALRDDIFAYDNLLAHADFSHVPGPARTAFEVLHTTSFELVMRALRAASQLLRIYKGEGDPAIKQMQDDANALREVLASVIALRHPDGPFEISDEQYKACRTFLAHFERIYSLNYDLVLYWTCMQDLEPAVSHDDGFRTPEDGPEEYVTWEVENTNKQTVFYLHGSLHVFDAGSELKKYTWKNTGIRLITQIREALAQDLFPLFVAEGSSQEKKAKILHSMYLSRSYRSLINIGGNLFVYGVSFAENDEHLCHAIEKCKVRRMFVGLYGDPDSESNKRIITRVMQMPMARAANRPLEIRFFDAGSARVWG